MKKCKRKKALFGIDDALIALAITGISAAASGAEAGVSAANAKEQRRINTFETNLDTYNQSSANLQQALNSNINNPNYAIKNIQTLSNQMKCGGRKRVKKCGGGRYRRLYGGDFVKKCI